MEGFERRVVVDADGRHPPRFHEVGEFRTDAGVVESRAHAVGFEDLAVTALEEFRPGTVEDAVLARPQRGRMGGDALVLVDGQARTARFDGEQRDAFVVYKVVERAHRVRPAARTGDDAVRKSPGLLPNLFARFLADDGLEVADHLRERMWADDAPDDVVGVFDVRRPVAHGLVDGLLQRSRPDVDGVHLGVVGSHPEDVRPLAVDVGAAHEHLAVDVEVRGGHRGCGAVLSRARLGDDTLFAHVLRQQHLSERVVQFVRAAVEQVLAFQVDVAVVPLAQRVGALERRRSAAEIAEVAAELVHEAVLVVEDVAFVGRLELLDCGHQHLGDVLAAVLAELRLVYLVCFAHAFTNLRVLSPTSPSMMALPTNRASAPASRIRSTSAVVAIPLSATSVVSSGTTGATDSNVPKSTSNRARSRLFTPMRVAPASSARFSSSPSWTSTRT